MFYFKFLRVHEYTLKVGVILSTLNSFSSVVVWIFPYTIIALYSHCELLNSLLLVTTPFKIMTISKQCLTQFKHDSFIYP